MADGTIRYNGRPSVEFTAETTQFDDELIKRGIISHEQAIYRKGATAEEAQRLASAAASQAEPLPPPEQTRDSDSDDEFLDDEFLERYRSQRIQEMSSAKKKGSFGQVVPISRSSWRHEVNQASEKAWVVVCLLSNGDSDRTVLMERAMNELAPEYSHVKFVTIVSDQAVQNWPEENLPSLFLYRDGKMKHELVRLSQTLDTEGLVEELEELSILQEELTVEDF